MSGVKNRHDNSGVTYTNLVRFVADAEKSLAEVGDEDARFRFEMLHDWLVNHYHPSKPLNFESKILGL